MRNYTIFIVIQICSLLTYLPTLQGCNNDTTREGYAKKENFCLNQTSDQINNAYLKQFIFLTPDQAKLRSLLSKKVKQIPSFHKLPCAICFNEGKEAFYQGEPSLRTHLFKHSDKLEVRQEALKHAHLIATTVYDAQTMRLMKYHKE